MEPVRQGYKRTDVGVIPEDWDVQSFDKYITSSQNGFGRRPKSGEKGTIVLRLADINEDRIDLSNPRQVNMSAAELTKYRLSDNDLLFLRVNGSREYVGRCVHVDKDYGDIAYNDHFIRVTLSEELDGKFVSYLFASKFVRSRLLSSIPKAIGGQLTINQAMLRGTPVVVPLFNEQRAIAEALTDVDVRLATLDTLIAKKRAIKKSAMQRLLTGEERLPGFEGEWTNVKVGSLGYTFGGLTGKSKVDFGNGNCKYIPFLNVMNNVIIDTSNLETVNVSQGENQNLVTAGDLLFNTSSETPEEVGMCAVLLDDITPLYLNSFCFGFRFSSSKNASSLFFAYMFRSSVGRDLMYSLAQGATRYNLSKRNFLELEVRIPSNEEQRSIAQLLLDMDIEITILEAERDKVATLKQGMMQELLTGRTRLI